MGVKMKTIFKSISRLFLTVTLAVVMAGVTFHAAPAQADVQARIKDIVQFEGVRDNMLIGYGLAVGLNGTGDTLNNAPFTQQSLIGMLERLGVSVTDLSMTTKNVAAVMVTATLPPFSNEGTRIDVTVSTLGDAKSLEGGTLLVTPLLGADGKVYAVAQGSISVGGFTASGSSGSSVTQNIPTTGRISDGAIVEREIPFRLNSMKSTRLSLRNPDFTTAHRIVEAINKHMHADIAHAQNSASVEVSLPPGFKGDMTDLITDIDQLKVTPDQIARVVIDERSGVIVMGAHVHISTVALAQGNLTIRISETPQVSQPAPFSQGGTTTTVPRTSISVDSGSGKKVALLKEGVSLQDLVTSLNALGVGPRDIITILQSIKAAGALQAQLKVM